MGADPSLPIQKMLVAALKGNTDAGANVFDQVPPGDPFPRITVGDMQVVPDRADCRDGSEVFAQVDVWSRAVGYPQAKTIASQVRSILDANDALTLDGHALDLIEFDGSQALRDPDPNTRHVAVTFRLLTQATEET